MSFNIKKFLISIGALAVFTCTVGTVFAIEESMPPQTVQIPMDQQGKTVMLDINSDNLEYFPEEDKFVATGNAEVVDRNQGTVLRADEITFFQKTQMVYAEKNVRIIKHGNVIKGDFTRIDLKKESAIIDKPNTVVDVVTIKAKTGNVKANTIEALDGDAFINSKFNFLLSSLDGVAMGAPSSKENVSPSDKKKKNYNIVTKEIIVKGEKHRNIITLKNANIFFGKHKLAYIPELEITTDKELSQIETQLPEIGSSQQMGFYIGPAKVFHLPMGTTLKVAPLAAKGNGDFGYGGLARIMTPTNKTEVGYTTVKEKLVVEGEQQIFGNRTKLVYGANAYMDDGFLGYRLPGFVAEVVDKRDYYIKDLDLNFTNRLSGGYAQEYGSTWGTARFKVQGDFINRDPLWHYKRYLEFRIRTQYDLTVYGTGDNTALVRFGPQLNLNLENFYASLSYMQSGLHGETPFSFDRYYYGKSNVILNSAWNINKYVNLGYLAYMNLTKDNWDERFLAENQFFARIGPDDFKFRIGYDTVRERAIYGIDLMVGSDGTKMDFDKLKILNPNQLSQPKEERKVKEISL